MINISDKTSGASVASMLEERYGHARYTVQGSSLQELTPGKAPLVNGAVILRLEGSAGCAAAGMPARGGAPAPAPLLLVVCSGPDAGGITDLQRGTYTIGRRVPAECGPGQRIGITDPALSRHHTELVVGAESVTVRDLGSANGTWVDGRRVRVATVDTDSHLRFGYSHCRLVIPGPVREVESAPADPFSPLTVRFPEQGQKTGLLLVGALLPLLLGVVLAVATGMWMFLAFSALSAVTALLGAAGSRRRRREQAAAIALAAEEDGKRLRRAAPDPGATALGTGPAGPPVADASAAVYPVRIGAGTLPANIEVVPAPRHFTPPQISEAPVILALGRDRDIRLEGTAREQAALGRTILLQAAAAFVPHLVCIGTASELEPNARFLPGVTLAAMPEVSLPAVESAVAALRNVLTALPQAAGPADLVLFVHAAWAEHAGRLLQALPEARRPLVTVIRAGGLPAPVSVSLLGGRGTLAAAGRSVDFVPDLIQPKTFERLSRALASRPPSGPQHAAPGGTGQPPPAAAFEDCHPAASPDLLLHGWRDPGSGVAAVVGLSFSGPVLLELDKDGPHFLVAGTTGSGKSEFLRTFIGSLAALYPPTDITALLIDFKGGSGLGPLAALPHTVGFLTDFSAENVSRALVSLRAEVRRREALLAAGRADNLSAYNFTRPPEDRVPKLLVVVDEFRMLAEEVPTALPELLRIAAIGRSLGLHLVLATQRPQGAVTADIRANIATSVALRVQSAAESRDVIDADAASTIPPDLPGRAYVSKGGRLPLAFQSLSTAMRSGTDENPLKELHEHLSGAAGGARVRAETTADPDALHRMVTAIRAAADTGGYPDPFNPVRPPLPSALTADLLAGCRVADEAAPDGLVLGLMDEPGQQRQRILAWQPGIDFHLAVLGAPRSGAPDALGLIAAKHVTGLPGRHLYVLDSDGSLAWLAAAEQTGAYVGPQEVDRASRVLAYLAAEVLHRLGPAAPEAGMDRGPAHTGGAVPAAAQVHGPAAGVTLIITGWSRWCTAFRTGRGLTGEEDLSDLIRDGERADICVVLAGDREVLSARFFPLIPNRMYFPADASAETLLIWPRLPPMDRIRGRALVQGRCGTAEGLSTQLLTADIPPTPEQLVPLPSDSPSPHRIENLPAFVPPAQLKPARSGDWLPVGVFGDELATAAVRVLPGSVFLVAGPRGSGRTSFLRQLQRSADISSECVAADLAAALSLVEQGEKDLRRFLVLVDDADSLSSSTHQKLAKMQALGARLVLAAVAGHQLTVRVPLAQQIRSAPRGALLQPVSPVDGDIFGIRVEPGRRRPPGRCYLVDGAEVREAQAAYSAVE
ncbi:FtsK/SpoIIIE domain-containing protein [Arthrobacter zhaoxinii]|uniref:FtsK/SpoIIIE domain-containing protein n=1 Tax=Arthrobacter zhaoxinii TaxID=2964616 RepID=A0ABY5YQI0_9MICC|nr:FtsK/SpoIIIE domain-containing protein [Arthrobacter zhaoxinii]UWX96304.1 FtsK/SpoIIIE domain-containing protein [Arthrobacter zhaoxinii]